MVISNWHWWLSMCAESRGDQHWDDETNFKQISLRGKINTFQRGVDPFKLVKTRWVDLWVFGWGWECCRQQRSWSTFSLQKFSHVLYRKYLEEIKSKRRNKVARKKVVSKQVCHIRTELVELCRGGVECFMIIHALKWHFFTSFTRSWRREKDTFPISHSEGKYWNQISIHFSPQ